LPYKPPRENITLLKSLVPDLEASKVESAPVPSLKNLILVDNSQGRINTSPLKATTPFSDLLNGGLSLKGAEEELHPDEIVNIQFTSGTTSTPKAACLSHKNILNNGFFIGRRMGLTPTDIVCCPPPLLHCFGCFRFRDPVSQRSLLSRGITASVSGIRRYCSVWRSHHVHC
jgi:acyl-CoA synthetase (AMP-forming)/AMP-acid ligase II